MKEVNEIKCKKPLVHKPEFKGKYHCMQCANEEKMRDINEGN